MIYLRTMKIQKTMPEQKMTYQERLDSVIKELYYLPVERWGELGEHATAKLIIASQAEAIREAMMHAFESCGIYTEIAKTTIDWYILEYGYIEPKTEEDGKK